MVGMGSHLCGNDGGAWVYILRDAAQREDGPLLRMRSENHSLLPHPEEARSAVSKDEATSNALCLCASVVSFKTTGKATGMGPRFRGDDGFENRHLCASVVSLGA